MQKPDDLEPEKGRKPKVQINLRPRLAKVFRYIARSERRELSDLFHEMLAHWLKTKGPKQYRKLDLDDEK